MAAIDTARLRPVLRADLVRVGPRRDGGYVVPGDLVRDSEHLLALGIGDDWQFEAEFARVNPRVRILGVDGSIGAGRFARECGGSLRTLLSFGVAEKARRRHWTQLRRAAHDFWFFGWRHRHLRHPCDPVSGFPDAVEITLVHDRLCAGAPVPIEAEYPRAGLDYPNHPGRPDHAITFA